MGKKWQQTHKEFTTFTDPVKNENWQIAQHCQNPKMFHFYHGSWAMNHHTYQPIFERKGWAGELTTSDDSPNPGAANSVQSDSIYSNYNLDEFFSRCQILKCVLHINGFQPEWCISTTYHASDTPFWLETLDICSKSGMEFQCCTKRIIYVSKSGKGHLSYKSR